MTPSPILTAARACSSRTGATADSGSMRSSAALPAGGVSAVRSRSSSLQVELDIGFYVLALESFVLGFALCAKPIFFAKI